MSSHTTPGPVQVHIQVDFSPEAFASSIAKRYETRAVIHGSGVWR